MSVKPNFTKSTCPECRRPGRSRCVQVNGKLLDYYVCKGNHAWRRKTTQQMGAPIDVVALGIRRVG
jgi:hypothetical protein